MHDSFETRAEHYHVPCNVMAILVQTVKGHNMFSLCYHYFKSKEYWVPQQSTELSVTGWQMAAQENNMMRIMLYQVYLRFNMLVLFTAFQRGSYLAGLLQLNEPYYRSHRLKFSMFLSGIEPVIHS
jgi:hypothetical protein